MNRVSLIGRLTKDPEIRYTQSAEPVAVASFTLAVDRRTKERDADFITCKAFGKTAQFFEKYFSKGMKAAVSGRIQTGNYTNREGQKVYTTDVIVEEVEFCEKAENTAQTQYAPQYGAQQQQASNYPPQYQNAVQAPQNANSGFMVDEGVGADMFGDSLPYM